LSSVIAHMVASRTAKCIRHRATAV